MAGFSINLTVGTDAPKSGKGAGDPGVLELRVHGVNNTTPAALLDLPDDGVQLVMGDKLGSFWEPTADAAASAKRGRRGHVPPGITREAYSWGGMVRTTPNFGGVGAAGAVAAVVARVLYALILPFSIGNAVAWSRKLTTEGEPRVWAGFTAGLARLFGLTLTLVFTTAAATLSIDMIGAQCAEQTGLCTPIQALLDPLAPWTSAQRLALFALGPVLAVAGLWAFSAFSRLRYDVLPGMADDNDTLVGSGTDPQTGRRRPTAALSQPGFWSNRITRLLARAHLSCAILLTTALVAQDAAVRAYPGAGGGETGRYTTVAVIAWSLFFVAVIIVCVLPTMTIPPIEGRGVRWPSGVTAALLVLSIGLFAAILAILVWFTDASAFQDAPTGGRGLYGAGSIPLVLIGFAGLLTLSGIFWRPWRGRRATAWAGCAPAVFMTVALSLAVATSSILIVTVGNWLNGSLAASDLIRDHKAASSALQIPSVWVGLGATILASGLLAVLLVLTTLAVRRTVAARAAEWNAPAEDGDQVIPVGAGVMPVSQSVLLARIDAKRRSAALLHLVEPATAILGVLLATGLLLGWVWTCIAYLNDQSLWAVLPSDVDDENVKNVLNVAMWGLGASGLFLVGMLASGATASTPRPLGIVWDIACYLPRTGQPFGPPCFAQRAVPEIAGRMYSWLLEDDKRKVVLVAHSMGAVLAVSSLGLLASTPDSRRMLDRISLLTFGVQLRAYFGRMLPELLGPVPLDTRPSRGPGFFRRDPWQADRTHERGTPGSGAASDRLGGTLLAGWSVRWVSLWRLTDFLGFPAMSTVPASADGSFRNGVDRFARELDTTGYMVDVGTHGEYFREPEYDTALLELAGLPPEK